MPTVLVNAAADAWVHDVADFVQRGIDEVRTRSSIWFPPSGRKMNEIVIGDAVVITEIGFAELPICPQIREETVVKKKPNRMIRIAPSRLTPICGKKASTIASPMEPNTVTLIGKSSSVRSLAVTAWPRRLARISANPARNA